VWFKYTPYFYFAEIKECMFLFCRVTEALFSLVQRGTNTAVVAMSTINNLALEKGYDVCIMWNMLWRAVHLSFLSFLSLKVYMTQKIYFSYLKGLSKYRRMAFFFRNIFFQFRDIDIFECKLDQWFWRHTICN